MIFTAALTDQFIVIAVASNPKPEDSIGRVNAKRSMVKSSGVMGVEGSPSNAKALDPPSASRRPASGDTPPRSPASYGASQRSRISRLLLPQRPQPPIHPIFPPIRRTQIADPKHLYQTVPTTL